MLENVSLLHYLFSDIRVNSYRKKKNKHNIMIYNNNNIIHVFITLIIYYYNTESKRMLNVNFNF